MKLVTIILLLCVHSADPADCKGEKGLVKFCDGGDKLEITIATTETVIWNFGEGSLPPGNKVDTSDASKTVMTLPNLKAEHTGLYTATYPASKEDKFTIIVEAVTCTINEACDVATGASIKLDSGLVSGVSWIFTASGGSTETAVGEAEKFTNDKKVLGLFNMKAAESGKYTAKKAGSPDVEFPVSVSDRTHVSSVKIKKQGGKARVCPDDKVEFECTVIGDAKPCTWTKNKAAIPPSTNIETTNVNKLTIKKATSGDTGSYACKVQGYYSDALVTSRGVVLTVQDSQAVSDVRITQEGRTLTCVATGAVKHFKWQMDGTKVPPQHGSVGGVDSVFNLTPKAKGNFVCEATGCNGTPEKSEFFGVGGGAGSDTNKEEVDNGDGSQPGSGPQGASTSVALLLISVLVELYVMML